MAALTVEFLQKCRDNIQRQGQDHLNLVQQAIGSKATLDELIAYAQTPEPAAQDGVSIQRPSNVLTVDEIRAASRPVTGAA